jgi:hypothetical protein
VSEAALTAAFHTAKGVLSSMAASHASSSGEDVKARSAQAATPLAGVAALWEAQQAGLAASASSTMRQWSKMPSRM